MLSSEPVEESKQTEFLYEQYSKKYYGNSTDHYSHTDRPRCRHAKRAGRCGWRHHYGACACILYELYTAQAQGTSLAVLTLPVVIFASLYYYHQCQKAGTPIDLRIVGLLCAGFVVGAFFGSKIALMLDQEVLKKIFAVILFYTAFKMLHWDEAIIKWVKGIF